MAGATMITVAHLITGLDTGGAERMLAQLVARTDRGRMRSVVISMTEPGGMAPAIERAGVPLRDLGVVRGRPDPRALPRLARVLREFRPDILQTWLYHADFLGMVARRLGLARRLVWNLRCTESGDSGVIRRVLAWNSRTPDAVVVNSIAGESFHEGLGYRPRRWVYLPNGFDTDTLRPDPQARARRRGELGFDDQTVAIALPARYHAMKDHATFLAAAARLAACQVPIRFVLIGAGNDRLNPALAEAIASHRLEERVLLLGERGDLAGLYPAFDIVTLSSAFGEGFPNVLGEAMCCGVPCVATDIGDSAAIIGATGAVVPPRDPEALAAAWARLIERGPAGRAKLGAKARTRIERDYRLAGIVSRYEALYEEITAG